VQPRTSLTFRPGTSLTLLVEKAGSAIRPDFGHRILSGFRTINFDQISFVARVLDPESQSTAFRLSPIATVHVSDRHETTVAPRDHPLRTMTA
jgi:hypothetical protein